MTLNGHSNGTANFGYNDIRYNVISLIMTLLSCPELLSIHIAIYYDVYVVYSDTSLITTLCYSPEVHHYIRSLLKFSIGYKPTMYTDQ